uniref:Ubiquitin receptor RAD23 n=1 Tax=Physcomitrium patens TaxID=3218 RepID=A0A2K1J1D4_PHYPA|nr:hypothetical protein PHYPA_023237 [Physcomitrium patens]
MKISVKTLKGNHFDLQVAEDELVSSVKRKIEGSQGKDAFPCAQQLLIHQGKVLKDETTMADNKVAENGFLVVMLTKTKAAPASGGAPASSSGSAQFQALRTMVQANPQILQPMLQELGKQNPALLRLINENQAEFLRLINEAGAEGAEGGDALGQLAGGYPQSVNVTPEEREAIERLEGMGFSRALVIEAFLACDKNEQLAANYLLENANEYDDL